MNVNARFGKVVNGQLVRAPMTVVVDGCVVAPNGESAAEVYAAAGWLPIYYSGVPSEPAPEGKHWAEDGWEETDGLVRRTWKAVDDPAPEPRRWTRFSIKGALADLHLLPAAKQFLAAYEIKPDYTALEAFTDVDYVEEGYGGAEAWNALLNGAAQALGKTRAEIDEFLDSLPAE